MPRLLQIVKRNGAAPLSNAVQVQVATVTLEHMARPGARAVFQGERRVILICVPSHNEGQTVGVVLWKVRQVMAESGRDYQILVADDGSSDHTGEVLEPYTRVLPLTVLRSDVRRGYGATLEMLLREAVHRSEYPRRDAIVVLQADFTEEPDHISTLLKRLESGADLVASNPARTGRQEFKRLLARFLTGGMLRRFAWPEGVEDPLAGFHAYRVSIVRRALESSGGQRLLRWEGPAANAALLRAAAPHARRVDTVEWTPRPERRQRETRFDLATRVREVWALTRNRDAPGLIPVTALAPTAVWSARSEDHRVTAESLRMAGVTRPGDDEQSRGRRPARSRNGKGGPGVKEGRRPPAGSTRESAQAPAQRPKRKPAKKDAAAPAEATGGIAPEADTEAVAGSTGEPRKKRPRRRKRPSGRAPAAGPEVALPEPPADTATPDETAAPADEDVAGPKARRRRGRRGGRRRSGRPRPDGGQTEPGVEAPEPPQGEGSNEG